MHPAATCQCPAADPAVGDGARGLNGRGESDAGVMGDAGPTWT